MQKIEMNLLSLFFFRVFTFIFNDDPGLVVV